MTPDDPNPIQPEPVEPVSPESDPATENLNVAQPEPVSQDEVETAIDTHDLDLSPLTDDTEILERRAPLNSAAPPRILAETPLGGQVRPLAHTPPEPRPTLPPVGPPQLSSSAPAGIKPGLLSDETQDSSPTEPDAGLSIDKLRQQLREAGKIESADEPAPAIVEKTVEPALEKPAPPVAPAQVRSASPDQPPRVEPAAWDKDEDDDLSPELAAVLFGKRDTAPAESAPAAVIDRRPTAPDESRSAAASVRAPEVITGPVNLTAVEDARRLPLSAQDHSAAAPDTPLNGKVRYTRVEEPLKRDQGQRIQEKWDYYKPDYPAVGGRLVRGVRSEERRYADGSWTWGYERVYTDGGRDLREVRANTDHTYIERSDEVSVRDEAGKRQSYREQAAMILAETEREEKRGFLSGLFGRDDDQDEGEAKKSWRSASSQDSRRARKQGGQAF